MKIGVSAVSQLKQRIRKGVTFLLGAYLIQTVIGCLLICWVTFSSAVYFFESGAPKANIHTFAQALWWGLVTFLTVGYGDFYPVTWGGRAFAGVLMGAGVMGIAIITSKISSFFLEQMLRQGRGLVNTNKLNGHYVICGWKEDMSELLTHILDFNPGMDASDLVMVANVKPQIVADLHEFPHLKGLHVIIGNYFDGTTLSRAAPERANKVLILADRTPNPNGIVPSPNEVDSRTIMTAMTLSSIARGTLVTAEILDAKMDQYLKLAQVSEIIYSREYSRLLLGNASGGTGISNIIFDLLDPKTSARINTAEIDNRWLGQSYQDFKADYEQAHPVQVIGILENTGNTHRIKEMALRRAQKTPDMTQLLENLRSVKELKCNHPIFAPPATYQITEGSMAIVIQKGGERHATNQAPAAA